MKRPLKVYHLPTGDFNFVEFDEAGKEKGPVLGPFTKDHARFELAAVYGFTSYNEATELLERAERDHSARSD